MSVYTNGETHRPRRQGLIPLSLRLATPRSTNKKGTFLIHCSSSLCVSCSAMAGLFAFIDPNNDANLDLLQTCLYTRLPRTLSLRNTAPRSLSRSISIRGTWTSGS